jgi:hypothetical protein
VDEYREKALFAINNYSSWWDIYGFLSKTCHTIEEFNLVAQEARILFLDKRG